MSKEFNKEVFIESFVDSFNVDESQIDQLRADLEKELNSGWGENPFNRKVRGYVQGLHGKLAECGNFSDLGSEDYMGAFDTGMKAREKLLAEGYVFPWG